MTKTQAHSDPSSGTASDQLFQPTGNADWDASTLAMFQQLDAHQRKVEADIQKWQQTHADPPSLSQRLGISRNLMIVSIGLNIAVISVVGWLLLHT